MDYKAFRFINQLSGHCRPLDLLMIFISNKIRYVFIFVIIFMWIKKSRYRILALNSIFSMGVSFFIYKIIKIFYFKPRPFMNRRVGILIPSKVDSSFPSKHTILVYAISTTIYLRNRLLGAIMLFLSSLTGFSRIWLGHHYPLDIIGSATIASITSYVINQIGFMDEKNEHTER
ncbi:undecaprenyl-diphosphatase [Bacillus sp. Bva_UNVM-123]|uniref:undecaprenyl-diphosphatase n=1 Tax=Bacillus sp. Bva_UNVM-123 TaxID=2829798 RepID=UPI00391F868A